jgi:hypothetical protein
LSARGLHAPAAGSRPGKSDRKKERKPAQCEFPIASVGGSNSFCQPRELAKTLEYWHLHFEGNWSLGFGQCKTSPAKNSQPTQCHQRIQDSHGTTRKNRVKRIIGKFGEILFSAFFRTNRTPSRPLRGPQRWYKDAKTPCLFGVSRSASSRAAIRAKPEKTPGMYPNVRLFARSCSCFFVSWRSRKGTHEPATAL